MSIESLREAVIRKAQKEAERIIEEAKRRAEEIIRDAEKRYELRVKRRREELISKITNEENMKYIRKVMELNIKMTTLKNEILNEVLKGIEERLRASNTNTRRESLRALLREVLGSGILPPNTKVTIRVVKQDMDLIKELIKEEGIIAIVSKIETLSDDYIGGLIIETEDGSIAVDNTYKTRLEKLKPEITKVLQEKVLGT